MINELRCSIASDVFSVGCLLYELFTFEAAYPYTDYSSRSRRLFKEDLANEKLPNLDKINDSFFENLLFNMLKKNPEERLSSSTFLRLVQKREEKEETSIDHRWMTSVQVQKQVGAINANFNWYHQVWIHS